MQRPVSPYPVLESVTRIRSGLPAAIVTAILLALAAVACSRPPADPSTPEGAVRVYLEALKERDVDGAYARLLPKLKAECALESLEARAIEFERALDDASVVVRRTNLNGDSATVEVSINSGEANVGPLGPRPSGGWDQWYQLSKVEDEWLLSEWGWPVYACPESRPLKPAEPAATPAPATATPTATPTMTPTPKPVGT